MTRSASAAAAEILASGEVPGEILCQPGEIVLNEGADILVVEVVNTGDRPIQVGSHYHFAETNRALSFDRAASRGRRLDVPSGGAIRFEPGQVRRVALIPIGGLRQVVGFQGQVMGALD